MKTYITYRTFPVGQTIIFDARKLAKVCQKPLGYHQKYSEIVQILNSNNAEGDV